MRYCNDCKKKFKEEDAVIVEYKSKEAVGKGDFPWQKLESVMRKIDTCPNCKGVNHFGMIEEPKKDKKWFWMMDYCKSKEIPPAQKWAWDEAEKAYKKDVLADFCKKISEQVDSPAEFQEIVNKEFWNLLD